MARCPCTDPGRGASLNHSSSVELSSKGLDDNEEPAKYAMSQKAKIPFEAGRTFSQRRRLLLFSWAARHWRSHILQLLVLQFYRRSGRTNSSHSRTTFRALAQALRHRVHSGLQDYLVG